MGLGVGHLPVSGLGDLRCHDGEGEMGGPLSLDLSFVFPPPCSISLSYRNLTNNRDI